MLMGIILHGLFPFYREEPDPFTGGVLDFCLWIVHTFRMPAFFMLSGFFGALLWERRGAGAMLMNRFERIALPLFGIMLVLSPIVAFVSFIGEGFYEGKAAPFDYALNRTMREAWPVGHFKHLWFLYHLLWISFGTAWFVRWSRSRGKDWTRTLAWVRRTFESPWRFVVVLGALNLALNVVLFRQDPPAGTGWMPNLFHVGYYALFYGFGWALYVGRADLSTSANRAWTLVAVGSIATLAYSLVKSQFEAGGALGAETMRGALLLVTWGIALFALTRGLMGLFYRYTSHESYTWRYVSDSSYWIYLIHMIPCEGLPELFLGTGLPILLKYFLCMVLTALIGFVT